MLKVIKAIHAVFSEVGTCCYQRTAEACSDAFVRYTQRRYLITAMRKQEG